jgi:hypothetical protein
MNIVIIMAPESLVFSLFSVASDVKVAWTECELRFTDCLPSQKIPPWNQVTRSNQSKRRLM